MATKPKSEFVKLPTNLRRVIWCYDLLDEGNTYFMKYVWSNKYFQYMESDWGVNSEKNLDDANESTWVMIDIQKKINKNKGKYIQDNKILYSYDFLTFELVREIANIVNIK